MITFSLPNIGLRLASRHHSPDFAPCSLVIHIYKIRSDICGLFCSTTAVYVFALSSTVGLSRFNICEYKLRSCNKMICFIFLYSLQIHPVTYFLPTFPFAIQTLLATKLRTHFHPGTANRAVIVETLTDDLIRRKIW